MSKTTVVIGCKMPNGLKLEIGSPGESGYRSITIKGANEGERVGEIFVPRTVGGFGRTEVDAKMWADWSTGADIVGADQYDQRTGELRVKASENRTRLVAARKAQVDEWQAKGLLFVVEDVDSALAQANEKAGALSGFEPVAQIGDPRAPKSVVKAA